MSTVTPKPLVEGTLLSDTIATLYTVPVNTTAVARTITITNHDVSQRTFTVHLIPSGGAAAAANKIFNAIPITAGQTLENDTLRVLLTGGLIRAFADVADKVSIRVDGSEVT